MTDAFQYSEARLAAHVGLSRDDCTFLRRQHLTADADWKKKAGQIALTKEAIKKLWRAMSNRPSTLVLSECSLAPPEKNGANGEALALEDRVSEANPKLLTVRKIWENPRVLYAADAQGREMSVIVGNNSHFVVGMQLPAVPDPVHLGFWRLVGHLPPRRGRWF